MENKLLFSDLIKEYMNANGLNQAKFAEVADIPPAVVSEYTRGAKIPRADKFLKIIRLLDIDARHVELPPKPTDSDAIPA